MHDLKEHFKTNSLSFMRLFVAVVTVFVFVFCCCCVVDGCVVVVVVLLLLLLGFFWGGGGLGISVTFTRWSMAGVLGTEPALRKASFLKDPKLSSLSAKKKQIKVL